MREMFPLSVRLSVRQIDFQCLFDLSWGEGQKLTATVPFPRTLETQYQVWSEAYHAFYESLPLIRDTVEPDSPLRGRVDHQGHLQARPVDWQAELVQAEADLFYQFHQWLRHQNLFDIRSQLAQLARSLEGTSLHPAVDIFLSASPATVARLPWEHWELGVEFGARVPFRVARCPTQLRMAAACSPPVQRKTLRVLAILGDERGLDFQGDREALRAIAPFAEIRFVGWQPQANLQTLKQEICEAIAAPRGWDLLFFAGHSNEKALTGGEFVIAPNQVLSLQQVLPFLQQAHQNGLQLAVFNSCNGMGIAERLLEQGLCQVAVMREPIHNQVAHAFLERFIFHLAQERDAQDSLHAACQDLKLSQGVTYPSAYCLPSLFRHPTTPPFQFKRVRVRDRLKSLLPTRWEAIVLSFLMISSCFPSIQTQLLSERLWFQAAYRDLTGQIPQEPPNIVTIQVDKASLRAAKITNPNPINRQYLAQIVNQLKAAQATVVGIDYLLDQPGNTDDTQVLNQSLQSLVQDNDAWLAFSSVATPEDFEEKVHPNVALSGWSLSGESSAYWGHVALPTSLQDCVQRCPMGYLLSLIWLANQDSPEIFKALPDVSNQTNLQEVLLKTIAEQPNHKIFQRFNRYNTSVLTQFSQNFGQLWFAPLIDFSIPSTAIYSSISAKDFIEQDLTLDRSIVLVGSGGYSEAEDNFLQPNAQRYWRKRGLGQSALVRDRDVLSGVELHGFMTHHLLHRRMVIPIPDVLMILLLGLSIKFLQIKAPLALGGGSHRNRVFLGLLGFVIYTGLCLQLFLSIAILIPWLYPSVTMVLYNIPKFWSRDNVQTS